jgi:hypothetical protein
VLVGLAGAGYRFLAHTSFTNDQFIHLAKSQAWLAGDWPIRDYTDAGAVLTVGASALVQALFGQSLLPELLLSVGALGIAAAVTCWFTARLTGSLLLGVMAALLQIVVLPRLYGYPKMLFYPVLLALLYRYADKPTFGRLLTSTLWVVAAFLFRQDHGVYTAFAAAFTIVLVHAREGAGAVVRRLTTFGAVFVMCLLPFLIYVQLTAGVWPYLQVGLATSRGVAGVTRIAPPAFHIASGPLLGRGPARAEDLPRIHIRWADHVDDRVRLAHERGVPLLFAERIDGRTWRYRVAWNPTTGLRKLLDGTDVEDASGVDRETLAFEQSQPLSAAVLRRLGLYGLEPGPPLTSLPQNAAPFLYYTAWLLPIVTVMVWVWRQRTGQPPGSIPTHFSAGILVVAALALLCTAGFQRDEPSSRTPDVFGTFPILFAWLIAALLSVPNRMSRLIAITLALCVASAVMVVGNAGEMVERTGVLRGPGAVTARAASIARSASQWPWSSQWPGNDGWTLARYLHDCTQPNDRLLVTWLGPEYYVFSRRPFAGREAMLLPLYRTPATYEASVLETWKRQQVPIVLTEKATYPTFVAAYPALAHHIATHYRPVADTQRDTHTITIYAERTRMSNGRDTESGWECFR